MKAKQYLFMYDDTEIVRSTIFDYQIVDIITKGFYFYEFQFLCEGSVLVLEVYDL